MQRCQEQQIAEFMWFDVIAYFLGSVTGILLHRSVARMARTALSIRVGGVGNSECTQLWWDPCLSALPAVTTAVIALGLTFCGPLSCADCSHWVVHTYRGVTVATGAGAHIIGME
jgi:hypothetical protein